MDWARILAYVTGTVNQESPARTGYLDAEKRIMKAHLKGWPKRLGRRARRDGRVGLWFGPQGSVLIKSWRRHYTIRSRRRRKPSSRQPVTCPTHFFGQGIIEFFGSMPVRTCSCSARSQNRGSRCVDPEAGGCRCFSGCAPTRWKDQSALQQAHCLSDYS